MRGRAIAFTLLRLVGVPGFRFLWAVLCCAALAFTALPVRAADAPGEFDYYVLSLSWSPTHCASEPDARDTRQCSGERSYAFVLHGLWPQYERGWPEHCDTGRRPWVPEALITAMLDIMPARGLVIHQYRKHGTCSGLGPKGYFEAARAAYGKIRIPARYRRLRKPMRVSPGQIEREFLRANPDLTPEMIAVACGAKRLREVRICFTRRLAPRACGPDVDRPGLCRREEIVMPPARGR